MRYRIKGRDLLEKCTEATMPKIHNAYPLAALSNVDYEQAKSWDNDEAKNAIINTSGKLQREVRAPLSRQMIQGLMDTLTVTHQDTRNQGKYPHLSSVYTLMETP